MPSSRGDGTRHESTSQKMLILFLMKHPQTEFPCSCCCSMKARRMTCVPEDDLQFRNCFRAKIHSITLITKTKSMSNIRRNLLGNLLQENYLTSDKANCQLKLYNLTNAISVRDTRCGSQSTQQDNKICAFKKRETRFLVTFHDFLILCLFEQQQK